MLVYWFSIVMLVYQRGNQGSISCRFSFHIQFERWNRSFGRWLDWWALAFFWVDLQVGWLLWSSKTNQTPWQLANGTTYLHELSMSFWWHLRFCIYTPRYNRGHLQSLHLVCNTRRDPPVLTYMDLSENTPRSISWFSFPTQTAGYILHVRLYQPDSIIPVPPQWHLHTLPGSTISPWLSNYPPVGEHGNGNVKLRFLAERIICKSGIFPLAVFDIVGCSLLGVHPT